MRPPNIRGSPRGVWLFEPTRLLSRPPFPLAKAACNWARDHAFAGGSRSGESARAPACPLFGGTPRQGGPKAWCAAARWPMSLFSSPCSAGRPPPSVFLFSLFFRRPGGGGPAPFFFFLRFFFFSPVAQGSPMGRSFFPLSHWPPAFRVRSAVFGRSPARRPWEPFPSGFSAGYWCSLRALLWFPLTSRSP